LERNRLSRRDYVVFSINGHQKKVSGSQVFSTLSDLLRYQFRMPGTKVVCAEGDCGACTIMVSSGDKYISLNSCIAMPFAMDGRSIVTVEGLETKEGLNEIQESMVRNFGGQCGFCTPGFVMSITNLHEQKIEISEQNAKNYLTGNLCRCTGYTPILKAALDVDRSKLVPLTKRYPIPQQQENLPILIQADDKEFYAPASLSDACKYKQKNPDVVIFSGSTDLGVRLNKGHLTVQKIMSLHLIPEMYEKSNSAGKVRVGARVTLSEVQKIANNTKFDQFLNIFASPQIKNAATLVGNIANASPIADTIPSLIAMDAELELVGVNSKRKIALKDFFLGYKKLNLNADEIISHVSFQIPGDQSYFENYKVSQRRDLDISCINASFLFEVKGTKIDKARIVYGGVGPTAMRLYKVEDALIGQDVKLLPMVQIKQTIDEAITPIEDVRGSEKYRRLLAGNLFEKYIQENWS
jgi:xanthine dehydrogenase small subunit